MSTLVHVIGLVVALAFILFGMDDLLWDVYALFRRVRGVHVDLTTLDEEPPKMLAIVIAAWHEDAVLGDVVRNVVGSSVYPADLYRIFLAVYPNDPATNAVADQLAERYANVIKVVNVNAGPSSKADNLNHAFDQIMAYESQHNLRFAGITIHDSEDVVHPLELKMTNLLIDHYDALQFPVFPLMRLPRFGNFFKTLTAGTYADEFAEHHFRTLVMRDRMGFVPSAGTGFCLSQSFLDVYGKNRENILPSDSLTEDYKLSLSMRMEGYRVHYVLERVPRINRDGRRFWDYIATRSMFPQTLKAAIRQKTRWVYGITMQSANIKYLFSKSSLSFRERTFLYKDLKAKFANFVLVPGYLVFIYFLAGLFIPSLPVMYPYLSVGWWLCVFLSLMMVERQFLRGKAIANVYGKRMMFFACLLPPLFPIRLIWGNVINICATTRAWIKKITFDRSERRAVKGAQSPADSERLPTGGETPAASGHERPRQAWAKTDHEFLPEEVLSRYRRRYGDHLLLEGALDEKSLGELVKDQGNSSEPLGLRLLKEGIVTECDLARATALQNGTVAIGLTPPLKRYMAQWDAHDLWERTGAWPIVETSAGYLAIMPDTGGPEVGHLFEQKTGKPVFTLVAPSSALDDAAAELSQARLEEDSDTSDRLGIEQLPRLCAMGLVSLSQAGIALGYAVNQDMDVASVLRSMGLLRKGEADDDTGAQGKLG